MIAPLDDVRPLEAYVSRAAATWTDPVPGYRIFPGTLVSVDISGFTSLTERLAKLGRQGAEEITFAINRLFDRLIETSERLGGDILKFGGDAMLILFTGSDHAVRGVTTAAGMRRCLREGSRVETPAGTADLSVSIGVESGIVILYLVGTSHRELIPAGPLTDATVCLEAAARRGEILVGPSAWQALDPAWCTRPRVVGGLVAASLRDDPDTERGTGRVASRFAGSERRVRAGAAVELGSCVPASLRPHLGHRPLGEHRIVNTAFLRVAGLNRVFEAGGPDAVLPALQSAVAALSRTSETYDVALYESDAYPDGCKFILATGAPVTGDADLERLVLTLVGVPGLDGGVTLHAGVTHGTAFVGDLGSPRRCYYTLMGDSVNLAARLMQQASAGQVLTTPETLERVRLDTGTEPVGTLRLKGKRFPVEAIGIVSVQTRRRPTRSSLPMVGRETELGELRARWDRARAGTGSAIEIIAEAGIGKSRLIDAFLDDLHSEERFQFTSDVHERNAAFSAVRPMLRDALGLEVDASPREAAGALGDLAAGSSDPRVRRLLPLVSGPFGADVSATDDSDAVDPRFREERMHETVEAILSVAIPEQRVLVFEDSYWMDESSRKLLAHLARKIDSHPWLLILAGRPGLELFEPPAFERMYLGALTRDEAAALGEHLVAVSPGSPGAQPSGHSAMLDDAVARAQGHPLFLIELLTAGNDTEVEHIPESVEALVTARIDTLDADAAHVLRVASVLGHQVSVDLLNELVGTDVRATLGRLDAFLEPDGTDGVRFRHNLHRDVAYRGLSYRARRDAHSRLAELLLLRKDDGLIPLLSHHYQAAGDHEATWTWSVRAGDLAREAQANSEAVELFGRALDAARKITVPAREYAQVAETVGDLCEIVGDYVAAGEAYDLARAVSTDTIATARTMHKTGVLSERRGNYRRAIYWHNRGLRLLECVHDARADAERARLHVGKAATRFRQGRYRDVMSCTERALDPDVDFRTRAHCLMLRAATASELGDPHEGLRLGTEALHVLRCGGAAVDPLAATIVNNLGVDAYFCGDWTAALAYYEESRDLCERTGEVVGTARADNNVGEILSP